jgi:hypothetical protein
MSTLTMPSFGFSRNRFTIHNAAPVPRTERWCGMQITIPPVDVVGVKPAMFKNGGPIPGTFVVEDGWAPDRDGLLPEAGSPPNWSAYTAVKNILGVNELTGKYEGVAAAGGLSFLPPEPTREQYELVLADGRRRYEISQVEWAQHQVAAFLEKVSHAQRANAPAPPPDRDYIKATEILKRAQAPIPTAEEKKSAPEPVEMDEMEFLALAKVKAMELAQKQPDRPNLDKMALAKELAEDPAFLDLLRKQGLRVRKKGHTDPEME